MKHALAVTIGVVVILGVMLFKPTSPSLGNISLGLCTVTESKVGVGHQLATTILQASSKRQWAVVQQPLNATNTVALSLGGTAVIGSGYELTPATSTSPASEFKLGFSTDIRTGNAVSARTSTGSTTLKVITCQ